ncbi:MAG: DUF3120 domain-containing protein [Cyanobacteria bacterium QS_8_64_29]|nr:MAG: DUF3120 domain-containing protein [Cyanobacteria bacterium QS_8_64_29]
MFDPTPFALTGAPQLGPPKRRRPQRRLRVAFGAGAFLVSVPVFVQAPLVRWLPEWSLALTLAWVGVSLWLLQQRRTQFWGDLLLGFSWTWLAGSIYWGWWRWEPIVHLPIESIGIPFALWGLWRGWGLVGNCFYLGSLFGTAITDAYFYLAGLIPYWREVMQVKPALAPPILQEALTQLHTPWGLAWALVLVLVLLGVGLGALQSYKLHWWAFSGAVLCTIGVDGLFWLTAVLA